MKHLLPGLRKFSERVYPKQQELFQSLSQGQKPHTLFITCSDSRIDPNLLTQTSPGEIFVIRNAGNIVPPFGASRGGEEAAIEFAIDGLGVSNVVICGHTKCGAMAALTDKVDLEGLPSVKSWLGHAHSTKKRVESIYGKDADVQHVVEENVLAQVDNLKTHPSISAALRAGRIQIYGWVYDFAAGMVVVYDPKNKRYLPSIEISHETEKEPSRLAL